MKFISLPTKGSSWQGPLIYSFATDDGSTTDVLVEIRDDDSGEQIATKRLYGVAAAEIDIAPYLRSQYYPRVEFSSAIAIVDSKVAKHITVIVNGIESPSQLFVPQSFDALQLTCVSRVPHENSVARGDMTIFSLFAPARLNIVVTIFRPQGRVQHNLRFSSHNHIVDVVIPTANFPNDATHFVVNISSESMSGLSLRYEIVERGPQSRQLLWRNPWGGVESYSFPHSLPIARSVTVDTLSASCGEVAKLREATHRVRLCSALESEKRLDELSELLLSPYVYEFCSGSLHPVRIDRRGVEYNSSGRLRQLTFDLVEEWKGGALL